MLGERRLWWRLKRMWLDALGLQAAETAIPPNTIHIEEKTFTQQQKQGERIRLGSRELRTTLWMGGFAGPWPAPASDALYWFSAVLF